MTQDQATYFQTLGFLLWPQLLSQEEMATLSSAFDAAMCDARGGATIPHSGEKRQQVVPFFDYDPEAFYPLLDDERFLDVFEALMGEDFIFTLSEGIVHTGGSRWHRDALAPEGLFSMRAAIYLDSLGPEEGCLNVLPGTHFTAFGEAMKETIEQLGVEFKDMPGRYPLRNEPGDVIFMNHKVYHSALSDRPGRRAIHINCVQNTTSEKSHEQFDWLIKFLTGETKGWGRFYSDYLIATAGPRRRKMMARAIELGFGNKGPITHRQDLA